MKPLGKVALVSGSGRGIGKEIAGRLAKDGLAVGINYIENYATAAETVQGIITRGGTAIAVKADVRDPLQARKLVAGACRELGEVDVLVNNVGPFLLRPLIDMTPEEWKTVLDANLSSAFYLSREVLPGMMQRRRGRIVNIGLSTAYAVRAAPNVAGYSIAKTGLAVLTRSLAAEVAAYGVTVNCVSPGLIDNGLLEPTQRDWMERRVPMGRLGRVEEVASAVAFLVSEEASYISGANLSVSGGWDWEDRNPSQDYDVQELEISPVGVRFPRLVTR